MLYAFEHASRDMFVQKAPASTIGDLAQAIRELFGANNPIKIIGVRHGESFYETLLTRRNGSRRRSWEILPDSCGHSRS